MFHFTQMQNQNFSILYSFTNQKPGGGSARFLLMRLKGFYHLFKTTQNCGLLHTLPLLTTANVQITGSTANSE